MVRIAQDHGTPSRLIEAVVAVNDARKAGMAARVIQAAGGSVRGKTVAIFGLTFKPETDDMRDAPSIPIIGRLTEDGAHIRVFDPAGMDQARPMLPSSVTYCRDALDAAQGADVLVVVTEWKRVPRHRPGAPARGNAGRPDRGSAEHVRKSDDAGGRLPLSEYRPSVTAPCGQAASAGRLPDDRRRGTSGPARPGANLSHNGKPAGSARFRRPRG